MEDIWQFRKMCDSYYESDQLVLHVGGGRTYVNIDDKFFGANCEAKLALDLYNKENQKNFNLVKVCKLNVSSICDSMTVCAQDGGSDEYHLFRCIFDVMNKEVLFCEIKYGGEISILVDDVDDYVKKLSERHEVQPSDTWFNKTDLGDGFALGSIGVMLVSPTMFRIMGEKPFSDLRKRCEDYLDPCLYNKCGTMSSVKVDCFDWVTKYAKLAINFYNKKEQKNFILVKVEKLYSIFAPRCYCMTFWARNGRSDEYRLFRALVFFKGDDEVYDVFTIPAEQDDACVQKLNESDEDCPPLRIVHVCIFRNCTSIYVLLSLIEYFSILAFRLSSL